MQIVWPEEDDPQETLFACSLIVDRFKEILGVEDISQGFDYFFVPDPPMSYRDAKIGQWLQEYSQQRSNASLSQGSLFQWGNSGYGYRTVSFSVFEYLIPRYLGLRGENLTLLAIGNDLVDLKKQAFQSKVVESIMTQHGQGTLPRSLMYAGLMFDWGRLVEEFSSQESQYLLSDQLQVV